MDGWKTILSFGDFPYFQGLKTVSFSDQKLVGHTQPRGLKINAAIVMQMEI